MGIENRCSLPFDTSKNPIRISQGNNGPWSHFLIKREIPALPGKYVYTDLTYAVDFVVPIGTEVRAAKSGVVQSMILHSDWCYEGLDPKIGNNMPPFSTNLVILRHDDGTTTVYSHLSRKVLVHTRQIVNIGDVIAESGRSGWIAETPHLHFQVNTQTSPQKSLSIVFDDYQISLDHNTLLAQGLIWSPT